MQGVAGRETKAVQWASGEPDILVDLVRTRAQGLALEPFIYQGASQTSQAHVDRWNDTGIALGQHDPQHHGIPEHAIAKATDEAEPETDPQVVTSAIDADTERAVPFAHAVQVKTHL